MATAPATRQMATAPANDPTAEPLLFDERGLVPCIAQDCESGEVLMFAHMNAEALRLTRDTGELHLWSRSRRRIWRKGESSGNVMEVRSLRLDCDGDCLLALVKPAGPACHTGERSCFFRTADGAAVDGEAREARSAATAAGDGGAGGGGVAMGGAEARGTLSMQPCEALPALERTLRSRADERPAGSYTVKLLDDPPLIGAKVREEAEEVSRAARQESERRVDEEAADLIYHLLVLLRSRGRGLADAARVLIERAESGR
jgi:phosphoribosyl-AMP cyclohydrolase / phosphoribosyl-ATP pyrophosphohydrolase